MSVANAFLRRNCEVCSRNHIPQNAAVPSLSNLLLKFDVKILYDMSRSDFENFYDLVLQYEHLAR